MVKSTKTEVKTSPAVIEGLPPTLNDLEKELKAEYDRLCAIRDRMNAELAPLVAEREAAANESERHRVKAMELQEQIRTKRGGPQWFVLKKEIGRLAMLLNK